MGKYHTNMIYNYKCGTLPKRNNLYISNMFIEIEWM